MNEQRPQPPARRAARPTRKRSAPRTADADTPPPQSADTLPPTPAPEPPASEAAPETPPELPREPRGGRGDRRHPRQRSARSGQQAPQPPTAPQPAAAAAQSQESRPQDIGPQTRGLTLLGSKTTVYSDRYTPAVLETFDNRHRENDYWVKFNCPEFTSLCPITGQPDFATIYIAYIPDQKMVESKSLKLYLFGFRNHGAFHEDCVNIIMKDLIKLMSPRYIEVWGKFLPRGGISIDPFANYGRPTTRWEEFARQRMLMHDLAPERVDNR